MSFHPDLEVFGPRRMGWVDTTDVAAVVGEAINNRESVVGYVEQLLRDYDAAIGWGMDWIMLEIIENMGSPNFSLNKVGQVMNGIHGNAGYWNMPKTELRMETDPSLYTTMLDKLVDVVLAKVQDGGIFPEYQFVNMLKNIDKVLNLSISETERNDLLWDVIRLAKSLSWKSFSKYVKKSEISIEDRQNLEKESEGWQDLARSMLDTISE